MPRPNKTMDASLYFIWVYHIRNFMEVVMAHIDRVDAFMQGKEMGEWVEFSDEKIRQRQRSIVLPAGRQAVWAVVEPQTLEAAIVHQDDIMKLSVDDTITEYFKRGKLKETGRSLGASQAYNDNLRSENLPNGYKPVLLGRKTLPPFNESLNMMFSFNEAGVLIDTYTSPRNGYTVPYSTIEQDVDAYMTMIEEIRDLAFPEAGIAS